MHNKHRGEISARLDGRDHRLRLSLGALAELETAFDADDMIALACRFESGRLSARDAIRVIGARLRGAGHEISDEAVAAMRSDEGAGGFVSIVVRLLDATFGNGDAVEGADRPLRDTTNKNAPQEVGRGVPFHGTT